jgi:hypothetical protein
MFPGVLILMGAAALYLVPSMLAWGRESFGLVLALNVFLGWTFFGYMAALFIAFASPKRDRRPKRECPECGELMLERAKLCPHCGSRSEPALLLRLQVAK